MAAPTLNRRGWSRTTSNGTSFAPATLTWGLNTAIPAGQKTGWFLIVTSDGIPTLTLDVANSDSRWSNKIIQTDEATGQVTQAIWYIDTDEAFAAGAFPNFEFDSSASEQFAVYLIAYTASSGNEIAYLGPSANEGNSSNSLGLGVTNNLGFSIDYQAFLTRGGDGATTVGGYPSSWSSGQGIAGGTSGASINVAIKSGTLANGDNSGNYAFVVSTEQWVCHLVLVYEVASVSSVDLTSQNISTSAPVIDQSTLGQVHVLNSSDIITSAAAISASAVGEVHILSSLDLVGISPSISSSSLGQIHILDSLSLDGVTPVVASSSIAQIHILISEDISVGIPEISLTTLGQIHILASQVTIGPELVINGDGNSVVGWTNTYGTPATISAVGGRLRITQGNVSGLAASFIRSFASVAGKKYRFRAKLYPHTTNRATIWIMNGDGSGITAYEYFDYGPNIDVEFIASTNNMSIALLGSGQGIWLDADDYAEFDDVSIQEYISEIVTSAPEISLTTIGVDGQLVSQNLVTSAPAIGVATLGQIHVLPSQALTTSVAELSATVLGQKHNLGSLAVVSGVPALSASVIGQVHVIASTNIASNPPAITQSSLSGIIQFVSQNVVTNQPQISISGISQKHGLVSTNIVTNEPVFSVSSVAIIINIGSRSINTTIPAISNTTLSQRHALISNGLTTHAPIISLTAITIPAQLLSLNIETFAPEISIAEVGTFATIPDGIIIIPTEIRTIFVNSELVNIRVDKEAATIIVPFENRTIVR